MRPDGGILSIVDDKEKKYPILITEMKNQGTNDLRLKEGKKRQAKGNAIERLGKNVIGFRAALLKETIFPFICFGDGCDFAPDSSILDRVVTISMFGELNKIRVHNEGAHGQFNRGSFFFREKLWTPKEMAEKMIEICDSSIYYYFSKYGKERFER
jgi:type II restriction enzyme